MGRHRINATIARELASIPGFAGCSARQLAQIDRLTDRIEAAEGTVLVRQGDMGPEAFVIIFGTAIVTKGDRLIATLGPGDYFGEFAAIEMGRRSATLTTISPVSALAMGPREFTTLVADIPGFRDVILRGMVRKIRAADDTIESMRTVCDEMAEA